jgi:hypothetical protein
MLISRRNSLIVELPLITNLGFVGQPFAAMVCRIMRMHRSGVSRSAHSRPCREHEARQRSVGDQQVVARCRLFVVADAARHLAGVALAKGVPRRCRAAAFHGAASVADRRRRWIELERVAAEEPMLSTSSSGRAPCSRSRRRCAAASDQAE